MNVKLRAQHRFDHKWLKTDLQSIFRKQDGLDSLWNRLINDGEVIGPFSDGLLNTAGVVARKGESGKYYCGLQVLTCTCCDGICGPHFGCNCQPCQKLDLEENDQVKDEKGTTVTPQSVLDLWIWGPPPTYEQLESFTDILNKEQLKLCFEAASTSLSFQRLHRAFLVFKRYFIALNRSPFLSEEEGSIYKRKAHVHNKNRICSETMLSHSYQQQASYLDPLNVHFNPINGLARVGSRAALNFSFAFLRRAWRLGEDVDLCSDLLLESLEALQILPVASLFDCSTVSPVWLEVADRSIKFLRQVVTGDVVSGRQYCEIPIQDQHTSLNILLELAVQKGTLSTILDVLLLLLNIHDKTIHSDDNRSSVQSASAPLLTFLKKFSNIPCHKANVSDENNSSDILNCVSMYRKMVQLPTDDDIEIDLQQASVFLISHLERLASPHIPPQSLSNSSSNFHAQSMWIWGCLSWGGVNETQICESISELGIVQLVCSDRNLYILTRTGVLYCMPLNSETPFPHVIEALKDVFVIKIAGHVEGKHLLALTKDGIVYSWGNGDSGRLGHGDALAREEPTIIELLLNKNIIDIECGGTYSAAISANGELYTWGRGHYGRLGHGKSDDCFLPTVVSALSGQHVVKVACSSGDAHTLCVTNQGKIYSWGDGDYGKLGRGGSDGSKIPKLIEELQNVEITQVYCGTQFSLAVSKEGQVYSWGKGEGWRLGHSTDEHVRFPQLVEKLKDKRVRCISLGIGHALALTDKGEVYGWGKNDFKQICDNGLYIQEPILIENLHGQRIFGVCCGPSQSFAWTDYSCWIPPLKLPFVIDLNENTFKFLDQLLAVICERCRSMPGAPIEQEKEIIAVSCLKILSLQLHCIISNNVDANTFNFGSGSKLLNNIKSKVVYLASTPGITLTVQTIAQSTLQAGWSVLLPTANERAQTLSSFLPSPGVETNALSSGHRFMSNLLVWSLMVDGGLEAALCEALRSEIVELAEVEETFETLTTQTSIPLLHLIKQLIKNGSSYSQSRLQEYKIYNKVLAQKMEVPDLSLLLRFQRLLIAKIYTQDLDCREAAESLLKKYLYHVSVYATETLQLAFEIAVSSSRNYMYVLQILKGDIVDVLLPELMVSLLLLQQEVQHFLLSMDWLYVFDALFTTLDKFCHLTPNIEAIDSDDMSWPGMQQFNTTYSFCKSHDDLTLIRKADLENHNLDGGLWVVINNRVYDVKDYRSENSMLPELLQRYAGKDATQIFNSPHNLTTLQEMESFVVGMYCQNDTEIPASLMEYVTLSKTLTETHRCLGFLLGLHAHSLRQSYPLQPVEIEAEAWLKAEFLVGGLQLSQPPNPYEEEKGEARSTNSTAGNTPTEPRINESQKPVRSWQVAFDKVSSFIYALAESRISDSYVIAFLAIVEQYCKQNNFLSRVDFSFEHPVEEIGRVLCAVLLKHLGLGYVLLPILDSYLTQADFKISKPIADMIKVVHDTKWKLIKVRQELNRSYKEVCIPVLERCRFLLYEVKPAVSIEMDAYNKINVLHKEPRVKTLIRKVIRELKCGKLKFDIYKPEDIVNATIQSQSQKCTEDIQKINKSSTSDIRNSETKTEADDFNNEIKNSGVIENRIHSDAIHYNASKCCDQKSIKNRTDLKTELEEKLHSSEKRDSAVCNQVLQEEKYKRIESEILLSNILSKIMEKRVQKTFLEKANLMYNIVDFLTKDHVCDIDVLRKAMYSQVKRCKFRKEGLLLVKYLLEKTYLLKSSHYAILNGYIGVTFKNTNENVSHCLDNIHLVTPALKTDILLAEMYVVDWCINNLRFLIMKDIPAKIGKSRLCTVKGNLNLGTYSFLRDTPKARMLLAIMGILAANRYTAVELNQIVNSGVISSVLSLLRQIGCEQSAVKKNMECYVLYANSLELNKPKKTSLSGPELASMMKLGVKVVRGVDWKWGDQGCSESANTMKDYHLTQLIRNAATNVLHNITVSAGLTTNLHQLTAHSLSRLFSHSLQNSTHEWCSLTMIKSISQSPQLQQAISTKPWIEMLLNNISISNTFRGNELNLPKQIHSVRLLKTVLQSWDLDHPEILPTVEKLLNILGKTMLTCCYDYGNKPLSDTKNHVLLTQSHSSTLSQEIISLMRYLHTIVGWNQVINATVGNKLKYAVQILRENTSSCTGETLSVEHQTMTTACLNVIGAYDPRPRIGALAEYDGNVGTITRVTQKGKLGIQLHNSGDLKKIAISGVKLIADNEFGLDKMPFNENMTKIWATLMVNKQISGYERKIIPGQVLLPYLRSQQTMLYSLCVTKLLHSNQNKLRKVLKCHVSSLDICQDQTSPDDQQQQSALLIQKILSKAVQPSPLKPCFTLEDMHLAALNLSQYLAAECNQEKNLMTSSDKIVAKSAKTEVNSELATPSSECSSKSILVEKKKKKREENSKEVNIDSLVIQIMEMGFTRKSIENAIKSLGIIPESLLTPESVVSYLLERPEVMMENDEVSDEYSSDTDSEFDNNVITSHSPAGDYNATEVIVNPINYMQRSDFLSNDEYAMYVRDNVEVGMLVRCCKSYEEVHVGDIGKIIKIDREGLHDLNLQVNWQNRLSTYWVRFIHVELLGFPPSTSAVPIKVGDKVRVKSSISTPRYKWGFVNHESVGIVRSIATNGHDITVDFPKQSNWTGLMSEMEVVPSSHEGVLCSGCGQNPIKGARFKCKSCDQFNYCENCFYTKKNHRHSFNRFVEPGSPAVFAGKPGRYFKNIDSDMEGLITDWSRCVKNVTVSSRDFTTHFEIPNGTWQSCGSQGKHWIRLEMAPDIIIRSLVCSTDPADNSYMPSVIVVSGGSTVNSLSELNVINVRPTDTAITLLCNMNEYYPLIEVAVVKCRNGGIDCKIHGLSVVGSKRQSYGEIKTSSSFLANDWDLNESNFRTTYVGSTVSSVVKTASSDASEDFQVYVWGLNDKDQLGGMKGSKVKTPTKSEILSQLRPIHIAGGSKSLFIVSQDGKLYACGEGLNGKLGLGHHNNVSYPRQNSFLSQYIIKKVAVHSGGKHAMALTSDGKVFSWGDGEDGKLGHGNRLSLDKPKMIETLRSKRIRDVACGSSHSAALTSNGELYTWGLGEYGRLGHGDNMTQLKPMLVKALLGHRVIQIACGSRDAQTLALTDEGLVFSWGDGDFGKLGRGGSEGCNIPHNIERLNSLGIIQVECGAQFSLALSKTGEVWTWGKGDYFRLGHGTDQHVRKPTVIESLKDKRVIQVAVGALHCLAVTDSGQVYAWGDNDHGQQGNGTTIVNRKPALVHGLEDIFINHVSCGSSHSIAWSVKDNPISNKHEPVIFSVAKDPLGASTLGLYDDEKTTKDDRNSKNNSKLSTIVMSLESSTSKQQALQHVLNAMHIHQLRQAIVKALSSHTNVPQELKNKLSVSNTAFENSNSQLGHNSMKEMEIACGGGEAPASLSEVDLNNHPTTPETDENAVALLQSMTSSCSASISSKHSRMSTSAMSVIAATLTSHTEVIGEGDVSGLDEFTTLLTENDARLLVDMLKLAVTDRIEDTQAKEIISSVLTNMGSNNKTIGLMLLEICVTELEDTASNTQTLSLVPHPVVQESSHPYVDDVTLRGHVRLPGADALRIEFDRRCSTERRHDPLQITDETGRVVATRSGREWSDWSAELRIPGDELHWSFTSDSSVNGWGWRFTVYPVISIQNTKELGSDKTVLSQPSIDMVMSLLDNRLYVCADNHLMARLAAALAECSQLSFLSPSQRMWALKKLHDILVPQNADENAIGHQLRQLKAPDGALGSLLEELPQALLQQYTYEDTSVRAGLHLMHSDFFKVLVALACDLELDKMSGIVDSYRWSWFRRYCNAARIAKALISRTSFPSNFCHEIRKKLADLPAENEEQMWDYENHNIFKKEHDKQLLIWLNRRPEDWTLSWGGSGTIYGWGHNHRGQLGGIEGAKVKIPTPSEALSSLRPVQVVGGEQTLIAVTTDGKVYATGYGAGGRLGIGGTDSVLVPTLIESIQHIFIKKVAVNSGGKHCLALTADNEVYSWGEGDDGKLGHGNRNACERPKLIEALQGYEIIEIACGGAHSAAITSSGQLFTWGKGRYGRLGHGDSEDRLKPKLVEELLGYRVIDVACGSGDAQTLCVTDDDNVWSWGDGDYGKLGRGGSDGCKVPMKIPSLVGLGVVKVECGSQFSVALTRSGSIYTWGKGDYHRLGHGTDDHVRFPKQVSSLQGIRIINIATGSLHCVACSDEGEVYTWGDNDEGQLGDGSTNAIHRPRLVSVLKGKKITNVACGSAHTLAWSTNSSNISAHLPTQAPLEYDLLKDIPIWVLHRRLVLLHHFAGLICPCITMFPLIGPCSLSELRDILVYSIKEATFKKVIQATMVRDKQHGPIIELNRIQVKRSRSRGGLAGIDGMKSVFGQMVSKLPLLTTEALSLPHRVWKVKFVGESVDDCGGGYSESIAEMCDELQNGSLPLFIPTPNGRDESGTNRDCFLLNPSSKSCLHLNMFRFLGVLMGIAIRTGSPLSLSLAEPVWKQLAGMELTPGDLTEVDRDYVPGLLCIRDMGPDERMFQNLEMPFSTPSSSGVDVPLSTRYKRITYENRLEYVKLALNFRLHEFDEQVKAVRDGMSRVIPVPLLSLFSAFELETMVCGSPDIQLSLLKSVATYKGVDGSAPLIHWFWDVMEEFSNQERSLFLRFVWGRTRLPRTIADFRGRDFVIQVLDKYNPPDYFLPESYTCFFLLKMPRYSCKHVLREKLKYAIHFCKSIDTDEYARVAMASDVAVSSSSDAESDAEIDSIAGHETL
ncbi:E3 ubiquitin-protein ligase HERC2 [Agrilus planipennis]|uniref:HECT-type E3 ubiquitin transferase n=1 Tax=Agrilus planipennis TaxID=224129 RepID=A0A7F5R8E1_AGRPL|nr:E3 ubiquitin-protein ligase HERC2 [Agrilus planipennis]